ncbi:hypothetical protein MMC24_006684 [Lignoscripta atroalba]|nr:hypothetical protein [Lignoscripta atroalba]
MRTSITALIAAAVAGLASAYTQPVGANPSGNPITSPGLNEIVSVGTPYSITWNPTTPGTVTLVLLRGPSTNILPLSVIVEGIPNTGVFSWTPSSSLEPDTTHYGIQLIVDATGEYQYTSQFGISNPSFSSSSSSSLTPSSSLSVPPSSSSSPPTAVTTMTLFSPVSQIADGQIQAPITSTPIATPLTTSTPIFLPPSNISLSTSTSISSIPTLYMSTPTLITYITSTLSVLSTGIPAPNSSVILPTRSMSVPVTLQSTSTAAAEATTTSEEAAPAETPLEGAAAGRRTAGVWVGLGVVLVLGGL